MREWNRRSFLGALAGASLSGNLTAQNPSAQNSSSQAPRAPNILLILADDLGWGDLGCYGQKRIRTPNLDRMASQGMRFTQAYAGSSVCAPSRCCLMTGQHNGHGRIRDNIPHGVFLQPDDVTVAEVLKRAGYRTGAFGKWSLGTPGSWGLPHMQGFDRFFGYLDQDHAHNYYPEFLWDDGREVLIPGNRANARGSYAPELILDRVSNFVAANRAQPFFAYYAPTLPHWSDYPKDSVRSQDIPEDAPYSSEAWPPVEKNYAAMVTLLDRHVGRILDQLRRLSIEQQTLVLFTSDNGPSAEALHRPAFFESSGPYRGVKRQLYEGGIRVPFLAQWPGVVRPGSVNDTVCAFWDLLPSAAELAGLPPPDRTDGISLVPALESRPRRDHEFLYWDYGHARDRFLQAVRKGEWKAVRNGSGAAVELYNLNEDPGESRNVAAAHPRRVAEMADLMKAALVESPDYPIRDRVRA